MPRKTFPPKTKTENRGGARPGAGRPRLAGAKKPVTVWFDPDQQAHLAELGGGSVQDGLRLLVAQSMAKAARPKRGGKPATGE